MPASHPCAPDRSPGEFVREIVLGTLFGFSLIVTDAAAQSEEIERIFGTPAVVAARQDSLLRLIVGATDRNNMTLWILGIAQPGAAWHSMNGMDVPPPEIKYPGIVARLQQAYPYVGPIRQPLIVSFLAPQAERAEAIAFLRELAQGEDGGPEYERPVPLVAVAALSRMGAEGAAELQRLHAAGVVTEVMAKVQLEHLARTGYRRPPGG